MTSEETLRRRALRDRQREMEREHRDEQDRKAQRAYELLDETILMLETDSYLSGDLSGALSQLLSALKPVVMDDGMSSWRALSVQSDEVQRLLTALLYPEET